MEALFAVVLFSGSLTALALVYRGIERRSGRASSVAPPVKPSTQAGRSTTQPTPLAEPTPTPPSPPVSPPEVVPTLASPRFVEPPTIPDPWLTDTEEVSLPSVPPTARSGAIPQTEPLSWSGERFDLTTEIACIGLTGQIQKVAHLQRYANHTNSQVRAAVAIALGRLATNKPGKLVEGMVPVLGKLSQDRNAEVRLAAVEALGQVRSPKVLPWLQQVQKTASGELGKAVTVALQNLKLIYQPKPKTPVKPIVK